MAINQLCLDLAGLTPTQRRLLVLHERYRLRVDDLAATFDMLSANVTKTLESARSRYLCCFHRFNFENFEKRYCTLA